MVKESGVVMAFDFGLKNIGIAIGQNITKSASTFYASTFWVYLGISGNSLLLEGNKKPRR